jgi:hypothetical protein
MQTLIPSGPFLLILWHPAEARCEVRGTLADKALAFEMLDRAKRTLIDHYQDLANQSLIEKPKIQIVTQ